jgi:nicotinate-nucleotide adenylyltransferase
VRIGVLGGTFDPVHIAHLRLAEAARESLSLDEVLFVPAGQPWRKSDRRIAAAEHRLAMLELAIAGNDDFAISDLELRRPGPTYTADTLELLAGERLDDEFYFIVGTDALADLPNWHEPQRIVAHATLAVAARALEQVNAPTIDVPGAAARFEPFPMIRMDVSSTDIRARVAAGRSIRYLVPDMVAGYIAEHRLYRAEAGI